MVALVVVVDDGDSVELIVVGVGGEKDGLNVIFAVDRSCDGSGAK